MLVVSASVPVQLDSVYPPVGYNYLHWGQPVEQVVFSKPWLYTATNGNKIQPHALALSEEDATAYELRARKGTTLITLVRAVNRHRRLVVKEWQVGQEIINLLKYAEAKRYLSFPNAGDSLPWLAVDAEHFGTTAEQAAVSIIFRHDQQEIVLLESEQARLHFSRAVLLATSLADINTVYNEIVAYERRG